MSYTERKKRFLLVDCNNFFVSCERVFNPSLLGKPVVVLSSNDGCIIARSNESKALGIPMGGALHEWQDVIRKHKVIIYSSNFALYSDMSTRVMQVLTEHAADIEIYSVDEAFLHLVDIGIKDPAYYAKTARMLKEKVRQYTGIPVTFGIGPTKTLAKIATKFAKKHAIYQGVLDITDLPELMLDDVLAKTPVADVWGVGRRYTILLQRHRIMTARDLKYAPDAWIRKNMTINGLRTVHELRGIPCFALDLMPENKKSITASRSFGKRMTEKQFLHEAVALHASSAARQLRDQNSKAVGIAAFVVYMHYHDDQRHFDSRYVELEHASSYTPDLISAAKKCIDQLYMPGRFYKKAGVIISDIVPADSVQLPWFSKVPDFAKQDSAMQALDTINRRWGNGTLEYAATGVEQPWRVKSQQRSPLFTTSWHELLKIKI